eukprot:TRINITY_DN60804_c0_g1_i1.p1 TRINITY_DN60804_c0_g1~~TRINITY_DN60804_c0_g1_i1.p1  ORF type:complete len:1135 (-),score=168.16 TRINITY_DN60804_c0_g1_i1:320-3724(-)
MAPKARRTTRSPSPKAAARSSVKSGAPTSSPKAAPSTAPPKAAAAAPAAASRSGRPPLVSSEVYVRIRPFADSGGHADEGKNDAKTLSGWTETSVSLTTEYAFSSGRTDYDFPRKVFGPEAQQEEVCDTMLASAVSAFTRGDGSAGGRNVLFLAYGQTGTGKTHTMFGAESSLTSTSLDPGWGIFPRVADAVFRNLGARAARTSFVLSASAVEFYMFQCLDLLNDRAPCLVDDDHMPMGNQHVVLGGVADLMRLLVQVKANRTSRSTKMNKASGDHDGSSRSHAALILTLLQADRVSGECTSTTFSLVDLAGAERSSKTGEKKDMTAAMMEAYYLSQGGQMSVGGQGVVINYELFMMRTSVVQAYNAHKSGHRYVVDSMLTTPLIKFISGCFTGKALLGMVVTLSPAGQNGWETWFSCEYGTDLAALKSPVQDVTPDNIHKLVKKTEIALEKAKAELSKTPAKGAPSSRFYPVRAARAVFLEQLLAQANNVATNVAATPQAVADAEAQPAVATPAESSAAVPTIKGEAAEPQSVQASTAAQPATAPVSKSSNSAVTSRRAAGGRGSLTPSPTLGQRAAKADARAASPPPAASVAASALTAKANAATDGNAGDGDDSASPATSPSSRRRLSDSHSRGLSRCDRCGAPFADSDDIFGHSVDGKFLCHACGEVSMAHVPQKCCVCSEPFLPKQSVFKHGSDEKTFACEPCANKAKASRGTRPAKCDHCSAPFGPESPIYGCASSTGVFLCEDCADKENMSEQASACSTCSTPVGKVVGKRLYSRRDSDDILCEVCWLHASLPICTACHKPPTGNFIQVGAEMYHPECLKCSMCSKAIDGVCSSTPTGGIACKSCRDNIVNQLEELRHCMEEGDTAGASVIAKALAAQGINLGGTNEVLSGPSSSNGGSNPRVCTTCEKKIDGPAYQRATDGAVLCEKCMQTAGPVCAACGKPPSGSCGTIGGKMYHAECIKCCMCSQRISGKAVQTPVGITCGECCDRVGADVEQLQNLLKKGDITGAAALADKLRKMGLDVPPIDSSVANESAGTTQNCAACGKPASGSCTKLGDKMYHAECIRCAVCDGEVKGSYADTPAGLTCRSCCETISSQVARMKELIEKGDSIGAAKIAESLEKIQGGKR